MTYFYAPISTIVSWSVITAHNIVLSCATHILNSC